MLLFYGGHPVGSAARPGISFTGHLFGAVGGVLAAWYVHGREPDDADLPRATSSTRRGRVTLGRWTATRPRP